MAEEPTSSSEWQVALRKLKREVDEKAKALQSSSAFLSELKLKAQDSIYSTYRDIEPLDPDRPENKRVSAKIKDLLNSIQTLTSLPRASEAEPLDKVLLDGPRYLSFFGKRGGNISVSADGRLASRLKNSLPTGNLVFGDFPCRVSSTGVVVELIIKKQLPLNPVSSSSLSSQDGITVGFTLTSPKSFAQVPKSSVNIPESVLIGFNGQTMEFSSSSFSSTDSYHPALLKPGDRLALVVPSYGTLTGRVLLLVNGKLQVMTQSRLPVLERHLYLVVDLLGVSDAVSLVDSSLTGTNHKGFTIAELELLVKTPVESIKGCFIDKHGSNIKVSDDRKMANKMDTTKDFGNLISIALTSSSEAKKSGDERKYFEVRVKRVIEKENSLRIGVVHGRMEMVPPLISQLNLCTWQEMRGLQTSTAVGLLVEPHRLSVFLNGVLSGTKETAQEGAISGILELGPGIACVSVLESSDRLLYTKLELARVKAVEAARYIQRVYRSIKKRRKWRSMVRLVMVKNNMKKKEDNKIEKLLEQQILLQHRLLEKIDKLNDRPINTHANAPGPLNLPNRLGAVMKPISSNVSVDIAGRSIVRLDDYKTQLTIHGIENYCKLLFTCDKKTLGLNIGLLKDSLSFEFLISCNLNGDVFIDGLLQSSAPKLQPRPLHEGEVVEVAVEDRKFLVLVNNKLLCRLDVPSGRAFVPGVIGLEMWGGVRGVSFFGDPRMQSILPVDAKFAQSPARKYNIQRSPENPPQNPPQNPPTRQPQPPKYAVNKQEHTQQQQQTPPSPRSSARSGSSRFSGSLVIGRSEGGNFFQKVLDLIPGDMLGESSSEDEVLKTQPLRTDIRGSKIPLVRRANPK